MHVSSFGLPLVLLRLLLAPCIILLALALALATCHIGGVIILNAFDVVFCTPKLLLTLLLAFNVC